MCQMETEILMLELGVEFELKPSSLFSQFQAFYDFRRLRKWFKLDRILNVDIKQADRFYSWNYSWNSLIKYEVRNTPLKM